MSTFDPRIILGFQQYTGPDPHETMRTLADLAGRRMQQQEHQARLGDMLQQRERQASLADLYRANADGMGGGLPSALARGGFGPEAFAAQEHQAGTRAKDAQRQKFEQEAAEQAKRFAGEHFYGANTPEAWRSRWDMLPEPFKAQVPQDFDERVYSAVTGWAVPAKDRAAQAASSSEAEKRRVFEAGEKAKDRSAALERERMEAQRKAAEGSSRSSSDLRRELQGLPAAKGFEEVAMSFEKLKRAGAKPSAAGDLSMIFAYMKMLDPGVSVMEGDVANAQNAAGVPQQIVGMYNRVRSGERLSPEHRADFLSQAQGLYEVQEKRYRELARRYRGLAQKAGADPDDVAEDGGAARRTPFSHMDLGADDMTPEEVAELERLGAKYGSAK